VDCRGKDFNPDNETPDDSLDFRYGGSQKRHAIFEAAKRWNREHSGDIPFLVSAIDAWFLTDSRPETSADGRHWSEERTPAWDDRPSIGEADSFSIQNSADSNRNYSRFNI
jgi:hypothetical protein